MIPKIIHQTWKTNEIPAKWIPYVKKVQELNPDWEYKLWTDVDNEDFVKSEYPEFYDIFMGFSRGIMRADVIRYLIMNKIGGVYLDLDYEVLQPFNFGDNKLILPLCRSIKDGDENDELGNCIFASEPGHQFWKDVIIDLKENPPIVTDYTQVIEATGPKFLSKIYNIKEYKDVSFPDRLIYHPPYSNSKKGIEKIKNNGISLGIHHTTGGWKERWTLAYLKQQLKKIFKNK
ncbi:MAG TPA: glycosyltransferase [Lunatimonas sp.]|nr:glycosyltransferase [Lunatimonas sp.]